MKTRYAEGELQGDWAVFARIAYMFVHNVPVEDREDFVQNLLIEMAKVKLKYEAKGKPLREAGLRMVANYALKDYFRKRKHRRFGFYCNNCSIEERHKCRTETLSSECPKGKAHPLLYLDEPVKNDNGDKIIELAEIIYYKAIDIDARLDAREILKALPKRAIQIGYKLYAGIPLDGAEKHYLKRWQETHPARFKFSRNHLDKRILALLRSKPQGLTRGDLSMRLQVPVWQVNLYLNRLIKKQQVISVKRERSTRGRQFTPLLLIAGAEIPKQSAAKAERNERIRHLHFVERKSIKQIVKEYHHSRRTVRSAIRERAAGTV